MTYIAFEGVKGSGKSTLVEAVRGQLERQGVPFVPVDPTRPLCPAHPLELLAHVPWLRGWDPFAEQLYQHRSRAHGRRLQQPPHPLVIGDRSVVTTIVTRWSRTWRYGVEGWVQRCLAGAPTLRPPDHLVWIDVPIDEAVRRCARRGRTYGHADEQRTHLERTRAAMEALMRRPPAPLAGTRWHRLDGTVPPESLRAQALHLIQHLAPGVVHV